MSVLARTLEPRCAEDSTSTVCWLEKHQFLVFFRWSEQEIWWEQSSSTYPQAVLFPCMQFCLQQTNYTFRWCPFCATLYPFLHTMEQSLGGIPWHMYWTSHIINAGCFVNWTINKFFFFVSLSAVSCYLVVVVHFDLIYSIPGDYL